jgi:hypothetical protein
MTNNQQTWQFSLFYKEGLGIKNTIPLKTIDLNRLIEIYSSDHLVKQYQDIVNAPTDHYKKWIKDHYLPYISPYGVFAPKRSDDNIKHYNSNLLALDLDNLNDKAIEIQQRLSKEKGCVLSVLSPRLEGVKAFFRLRQDIDASNHFQHLKQNADKIINNLGLIGIELDNMQFTLSQGMYLGHSEYMFFNVDADEVDWMLDEYHAPIPINQCTQSAINGDGELANHHRYRIEKYLDGQCEYILKILEQKDKPRHNRIALVKRIASWSHYADPYYMEIIKSRLRYGVVKMYGSEKDAIENNALASFEKAWSTNDKVENEYILKIINEYSINLKSLEQ